MAGGDVAALSAALLEGDRRALARLLTWVEDGDPDLLRAVVGALYPRTGRARVVGVTGSPGVGKSTLTSSMTEALRDRGRTVGVLAVDPTSPFSGGALLGDRVRMQAHHSDPGVFIRSMAARGHLGGLAVATPHAVVVLDAAGFDEILVETVGVGQAEVEVAGTADSTVVVLAPGFGDAVQAAKAGILEVADLFVVNKADKEGAGRLETDIRGMLETARGVSGIAGWTPPILRAVSTRGEGVEELVAALEDHRAHLEATGELERRCLRRAAHTVREIALGQLRGRLDRLEGRGAPLLDGLAAKVANRDLDPYAAADQLLAAIDRGGGHPGDAPI